MSHFFLSHVSYPYTSKSIHCSLSLFLSFSLSFTLCIFYAFVYIYCTGTLINFLIDIALGEKAQFQNCNRTRNERYAIWHKYWNENSKRWAYCHLLDCVWTIKRYEMNTLYCNAKCEWESESERQCVYCTIENAYSNTIVSFSFQMRCRCRCHHHHC